LVVRGCSARIERKTLDCIATIDLDHRCPGLALIGATKFESPTFVIVILTILLSAAVILAGCAYVYLLKNDRDALRSESFTLQKIALERGLIGDNAAGLVDIDKQDATFLKSLGE